MPERVVLVELRSETKNLLKGFNKVDKRTKQLAQGFKKLAGVIGLAFSGRALIRGFQETLRNTEALIRTARGVGFATNEYRELIFALDAVGVSSESARIALGDLQKRLSRPSFQKFFRQVGLEPNELLNLSRAEQLQAILNRLFELRSDPNLPSIAGLLFEEQSGKDIAKVILQYKEFLRARQDFRDITGRGITKADEEAIIATTEEVKKLKLAWEDLRIQIVAKAAPDISAALKSLRESGTFDIIGEELSRFIKDLSDGAKEIRKEIEAIKSFFSDIGRRFEADKASVRRIGHRFTQEGIAGALDEITKFELAAPRSSAANNPVLAGTNAPAVNVNVTNNFSGVNERSMPGRVTDSINRELVTQ